MVAAFIALDNASGISTKKILGKTVNCFLFVIGFKPGIIGTLIPILLQASTYSKYFLLSKNICVIMYCAPASTFSLAFCKSNSILGASKCFSGYPDTPIQKFVLLPFKISLSKYAPLFKPTICFNKSIACLFPLGVGTKVFCPFSASPLNTSTLSIPKNCKSIKASSVSLFENPPQIICGIASTL